MESQWNLASILQTEQKDKWKQSCFIPPCCRSSLVVGTAIKELKHFAEGSTLIQICTSYLWDDRARKCFRHTRNVFPAALFYRLTIKLPFKAAVLYYTFIWNQESYDNYRAELKQSRCLEEQLLPSNGIHGYNTRRCAHKILGIWVATPAVSCQGAYTCRMHQAAMDRQQNSESIWTASSDLLQSQEKKCEVDGPNMN